MSSIGEIIERYRPEILRTWTELSGQTVSAAGLSRRDLDDGLGGLLTTLGCSAVGDQEAWLQRHMSRRLRQGFALSEIVTELSVLGRCITRVIEREGEAQRPPVADVARLCAQLYQATMVVSRIFAEHMLEDEQTEKRYRRLLERVVSEWVAARSSRGTQARWLKEILELLMTALGGHTAALMLADGASDRLIMSASVGDAEELLDAQTSALDCSTLIGTIAAGGDAPTVISDAETTALGVSEILRRSGIHALVGLRLHAGQNLRGVLWIGRRENLPFTAAEVRRLEGLGQALTTQLERAELHARLVDEAGARASELRDRERDAGLVATAIDDHLVPALASLRAEGASPAAIAELTQLARRLGEVSARAITTA